MQKGKTTTKGVLGAKAKNHLPHHGKLHHLLLESGCSKKGLQRLHHCKPQRKKEDTHAKYVFFFNDKRKTPEGMRRSLSLVRWPINGGAALPLRPPHTSVYSASFKRSYATASDPTTTPDESRPKVRFFTRADVAKHASQDDLWVIINKKVYNVSRWADVHPGGREILYSVPARPPQQI